MNAQDALKNLKEGNQRFVNNELRNKKNDSNRREELIGGQAPHTIILSCADSRVVPEFVFDQGLGEVFVIRVAGNIANSSSIASIEYAVAHLGTKLIVVMGHESCGAVTAAVAGVKESPSLAHLLEQIEPAIESSPSDDLVEIIKENAQLNADKLKSSSEIIRTALDVEILPVYYNLSTGKVDFL